MVEASPQLKQINKQTKLIVIHFFDGFPDNFYHNGVHL